MASQPSKITAFAPATVANVGPGFDVLGFAIHGPGDLVTARLSSKPGVVISSISGDEGRLPLDASKNTAGLAVLSLLETHGRKEIGIELSIEKQMPLGSGLGSSAASSAAAVVAVNEILNCPFTINELLPFAVEGEKAASGTPHADNVAASLLGGFVLVRNHQPPDVLSLPTPEKLFCTIIHPEIEIQTKNSRLILKKDVPLSKAVTQWANVGGLIAGLFTSDYELIGRSMHDELIEPVRSVLIPGFDKIKQAALDAGALGCSISGSGPSMFALSTSPDTGKRIGQKMGGVLEELGLTYQIHLSKINTQGAAVINQDS